MALDTKLRSDMVGNKNTTSETTWGTSSSDKSTISHFEETSDNSVSTDEVTSVTDAFASINEPANVDADTSSLLRTIERQLKTLNQSIADLEQEIEKCKITDFGPVLSSIDSARRSIEKAVSGVGTMVGGATDKYLLEKIKGLENVILEIAGKQDRNDRQLVQALRENASFQIQVRQGMQKDIDELKERQSGEQFNPILKEIASIYVEYQGLLDDESITALSKNNLKALFEQLEDLLIDYDAEISRSEIGATRQTRNTKIIGKVPTENQSMHNTIAVSRKPGVLRGRTVLYPEFVDVFIYDPSIIGTKAMIKEPSVSDDEDNKAKESVLHEEEMTIETEKEISSKTITYKTECNPTVANEEPIVQDATLDERENK